MIFRQLYDPISSTYTYLLAERQGGEALIIDPVLDRVTQYLQLVEELDLKLVMALDTHIHADHVTGIGRLRSAVDCATAMGEQSQAECVTVRFREGETLKADGIGVKALYTPGHTDDSYSFVLPDRVLTGELNIPRESCMPILRDIVKSGKIKFDKSRNDAYEQARLGSIGEGRNEYQTMFGTGLQAQQFGNQAAQQNWANALAGRGFNNQVGQQNWQNS